MQKPPLSATQSTVTNETVVINDPAEATYCVSVHDNTGRGSNFALIVSTEGGARSELSPNLTGALGPGETREIACARLCIDQDSDGICEAPSVVTPDQLHLVGPGTLALGVPGSIGVTLERNFVGVGGRLLVFPRMMGNLSFSKGKVSTDGSWTTLPTDGFGVAEMPFVGLAPGRALVKVSVPGTSLEAYAVVTIR